MKKGNLTKFSLILCVIVILALATIIWQLSLPEEKRSSGIGVSLIRPAIAQEAEASFLEKEAGISAYTNLNQKIDLVKVKTAFRTVERETSTYIVGSVPVPGYETNDWAEWPDVHCFVHKDGWIVAYYLADTLTAKIMYWVRWDGKTINTKIAEGLNRAASTVGLAPTDIKYYHFKYPNANRLLMIADQDNFKITIPGGMAIHERTFSASGHYLYIDEQQLPYVDTKSGEYVGIITLSQLKPDVPHTIKCNKGVVTLVYQDL